MANQPHPYQIRLQYAEQELADLERVATVTPGIRARKASLRRTIQWYRARIPGPSVTTLDLQVADEVATESSVA